MLRARTRRRSSRVPHAEGFAEALGSHLPCRECRSGRCRKLETCTCDGKGRRSSRSVKKQYCGRSRVSGVYLESVVDLVNGRAVQIHDVDAEAGGLDDHLGEGGNANMIDFAFGLFDVFSAIRLDVGIARDEWDVFVRMHLDPGARQELDVQLVNSALGAMLMEAHLEIRDDGHARGIVVEALEQKTGAGAIHIVDSIS